MKNTMEYKGYVGSVEFSEEDGIFFGKVMGIRSLISYEVWTPEPTDWSGVKGPVCCERREDILSHPGMVCDVSQRTFSETYALIDLDGDAAAERITLQTDAWKNVEGNSPVNYTFGVKATM